MLLPNHPSAPTPPLTSQGLAIANLQSPLAGPFDLTVAPGEIIAISGASGSGKSLFLRMLADLDPNTGEVSLNGRDRRTLTAADWRRTAPYVAAESGWWRDKVLDHFGAAQQPLATELAQRLGIDPIQLQGPVARLSTGERQRLALVRAFVLQSPVLLLDEPTGPLDPGSVKRVEDLVKERQTEGAIIVMVTHDPQQGRRLNARGLHMVERHLQAQP